MKKAHLFDSEDVAASIANGVEVTSVCGKRQVITKKSWKKGRGAPPCRKCIDLWAARQDGSTINNRTPRDDPPKPSQPWSYRTTMTFGNHGTWNHFPPAA